MRSGVDRNSGQILTGWAHCAQCIGVILTTAIGSLLMARDFGSDVPLLQDRPMSPPSIMMVWMAAAEALRREEPGFRVTRFGLLRAGNDGVVSFEIAGDFYPNALDGDFLTVERGLNALIAIPGTTMIVS